MARKRRRKAILRSRFYQIYFIVVAVALVGIVIGMFFLRGVLSEYESAQPDHVAEPVARLFEKRDFDALYAYDETAQAIAGGDRDFYIARMNELSQGKDVSWREGFSRSDSEKLYRVLLDGERFAEITLAKSGQSTRHGTPLWQLEKVRTLVELATPAPTPEPTPEPTPAPTATPEPVASYACTITVPDGWAVVVEGKPLSEANALVTRIPSPAADLLPPGVADRALVQYQVNAASAQPNVQIVNAQGEWFAPEPNAELTWRYDWPEDTQLSDLYGDEVFSMAKRFIQYSTKRLSQNSLLGHCAKDSPARDKIKNFDMTFGLTPKGDSYENVQMTNFCRYADNCFTCTISMDYVAHFGKTDKTYPVQYTYCFVSEDGTGKLWDFSLNG